LPTILATWETEIRRIVIQSQTGQKLAKTNRWVLWHTPVLPSYARGCGRKHKIGRTPSSQLGLKTSPYLQNNQNKRAGGIVQILECLSKSIKSRVQTPGLYRTTTTKNRIISLDA
jgi:hypothetical protein